MLRGLFSNAMPTIKEQIRGMLYLNLESLHLLAKGKDNEALHPQAMVADRDIHQTTHLRVTIRLKGIIQASVKDLCQDLAIHLLILIPGNTPSNLVQCKVNGDEAQDLRDKGHLRCCSKADLVSSTLLISTHHKDSSNSKVHLVNKASSSNILHDKVHHSSRDNSSTKTQPVILDGTNNAEQTLKETMEEV
jgi:hypothetical protein